MWSDEQRNIESIVDLIASDAAYESKTAVIGQSLSTYPDSPKNEEYTFPLDLTALAGIPYSINQPDSAVARVSLTQWELVNKFEIAEAGFGAQLYRGVSETGDGRTHIEYLLSFRGTDGRDGKDWYGNLSLATNQWNAAN